MHGVTKEISLPITVNGPVTDTQGNERMGFEGSTTINRMDYGVSWSATMDAGGFVVSENVKLEISFSGIKQ
jgi:polyisoprenoid-binding protein YceI